MPEEQPKEVIREQPKTVLTLRYYEKGTAKQVKAQKLTMEYSKAMAYVKKLNAENPQFIIIAS